MRNLHWSSWSGPDMWFLRIRFLLECRDTAASFATCFVVFFWGEVFFFFFFYFRQFMHPQCLVNLWLLMITCILPFLKGRCLKTMVTANKQTKQMGLSKNVLSADFSVNHTEMHKETNWASSCVINNVFNHRILIFRTCCEKTVS